MKGDYNSLVSTAMDWSGSYPKGRTACFDIGISGNCIDNCLLCRAFEDDFDSKLHEVNKMNGDVIDLVQELIDMGLIDFNTIKYDYIEMKNKK
jgi:hypothetical protein